LHRFFRLVRLDARDLAIILSYTLLTGILGLAVPLAAQALVNTVAVGIFLQPLVVLSVVVLGLLLFRGVLRLLKMYLIEVLQQRVFVRVSLRLADHLPRIRQESLANAYAPELANRFFDALTIQKSWAKLLLEGPAAILQSFVGLLLMAFYSPLLLAFDVVLVACGALVLFGLGRGGVKTSIKESAEKYRVAHWLEEVGRCERNLKFTAGAGFSVTEADRIVDGYLDARQGHFTVLLRQAAGSYLLQALASAGILAVGGWLVIQRQLTMGQLVASELIVLSVLAALEKLIRLAEPWFDLLTALEKIGHVTDLPQEKCGEVQVGLEEPPRIEVTDAHFEYVDGIEVIRGIDLEIEPGERLAITGPSGSGKTTLVHLITGLFEPDKGTIRLGDRAIGEFDLGLLRSTITMVGDRYDLFEGTLEQNIRVGRDDVSEADLHWALELTGLDRDLRRLPDGLRTAVMSEGKNLSSGQVQRVLIARALLDRPKVLVFDETIRGMDPDKRIRLLDGLLAIDDWTLVFISQEREVLDRVNRVVMIDDGRFVENLAPGELVASSRLGRFLDGAQVRKA
jgi:ATP-binding cassette subfamily B protein